MAGYRGYLPMLAAWPAAEPLIQDLRQQAGLHVSDASDAASLHALLYHPDGHPVAYGRLQPDGTVDSLCLAKGMPVGDAGCVLMGFLAEQACNTGLALLHVTPPDGWRHWLLQIDPQSRIDGHELKLDSDTVRVQWRLAGLQEARLGDTRTHWELLNTAEYSDALVHMARQAERSLRLFSPTLEHALFDNTPLAEAVSALARRSRYTEVRILIVDPRPLVQRGHALLALHRRLCSVVPILKLPYKTDELKDTVLLADDAGLVIKPERDDDSGFACFNDRPQVKALTETFDYLWHRGVTDPEIRGLSL